MNRRGAIIALISAWMAGAPVLADSDAPLSPSPDFDDRAIAALETCVAREFVINDINDDETPNNACALVGALLCSGVRDDGTHPPVDPACALAEFDWWLARMKPALGAVERALAMAGEEQGAIAMLQTSQAAWLAYAQAQCTYAATVRGADQYSCLARQASIRAAWLMTWAGEF